MESESLCFRAAKTLQSMLVRCSRTHRGAVAEIIRPQPNLLDEPRIVSPLAVPISSTTPSHDDEPRLEIPAVLG